MDMAFDDDAVGANDQEAPQRPFAHPYRGSKSLLAACGMLTGCEAEPSRKIARLVERLGGRSQDCYGRGNQRTYPRDCHQPPRHLILLGTSGDLSVELADLRLEMGEDHRHERSL